MLDADRQANGVGFNSLIQQLLGGKLRVGSGGGMDDLFHLRVGGQILHYLFGILRMALHSKGQGLHPLKEQEGVKGGDGRSCVPEENSPNISNKGGWTGGVHKADSMIAGIWLRNGGVFPLDFQSNFQLYTMIPPKVVP